MRPSLVPRVFIRRGGGAGLGGPAERRGGARAERGVEVLPGVLGMGGRGAVERVAVAIVA
eukprot:7222843-Pyramimonas_sp.AAC.1